MLFSDNEGVRLGDTIRKVVIDSNDPRFRKIGELETKVLKTHNKSFFYGWNLRRRYSAEEFKNAEAFSLHVTSTFEPAGEECGTKYDESTACPNCGAGAVQISDLRLDFRKIPKTKDICKTIADEIIVSQRLAERMVDANLTGFELRLARHKAKYSEDAYDLSKIPSGQELLRRGEQQGAPHPTGRFWVWLNRSENIELLEKARAENLERMENRSARQPKVFPVWHQLIPITAAVEIVPPTRVGINPFDEDAKGECRCPRGDLIGLNLLSEVSVRRPNRIDDLMSTQQFIGTRRGLLRPNRIILISPRFLQLLQNQNVKGYQVEVAHFV